MKYKWVFHKHFHVNNIKKLFFLFLMIMNNIFQRIMRNCEILINDIIFSLKEKSQILIKRKKLILILCNILKP